MSIPIAQFSTPPSPPHRGFPPLVHGGLCCGTRDLSLRHVGSRARGLSSCTRGMWDLSSPTRDQTSVPCIARRIFNHWTSMEVFSYKNWIILSTYPGTLFFSLNNILVLQCTQQCPRLCLLLPRCLARTDPATPLPPASNHSPTFFPVAASGTSHSAILGLRDQLTPFSELRSLLPVNYELPNSSEFFPWGGGRCPSPWYFKNMLR